MYAWWAAGRRVRMGACQWAGMGRAADIGMKRGDCAATYAGLIMDACIYTSAVVFWGLYLCNRLSKDRWARMSTAQRRYLCAGWGLDLHR